MADDVNKSKRGTPNQLVDSGFSDIERIGRRSERRTAEDLAERHRIASATDTINGLEELIESTPGAAEVDSIRKGLSYARETRNKLAPRIRLRADVRRDRSIQETRSAIEREFSNRSINGQAMHHASSEYGQQRGLGMLSMSSRELEMARSSAMNSLGEIEQSSLSIADEGLYDREGRQDPSALAELKRNYFRKTQISRQLGAITAAERQKRGLGEDSGSQLQSLLHAGKGAENILSRNALSDELKSGSGLGALNMSQLKQKEAQEANELIKALERLKNSANESAETVDKLKQEAAGTATNLEKTQEAIKQFGSSGGGGRIGTTLSAVGSVGMAATNLYHDIALNQTNAITGNRINAASMNNNLYDRRNAALSGDMTQLTMMSSDAFSRAANEGKTNRESVNNSKMGWAAAGLATAGAAAFTIGTGGLGLAAGLVAGAGGIAAATGAVSNITDVFRGASSTQEELAERQRQITLQDEMSKVTGQQRQQLYNYSMGSRRAALAGGGSRGAAFMEQFSGKGGDAMLQNLENARIGTDQFTDMSAQGFSSQGSVFSTNQVFAARNLERGGFGDMQTNMSRMGQLAGAGANNPQYSLQAVLEASFTKSLDSSKALNLMVDHTAQMAQGSAGAGRGGQDTTAGAAAILSNLVNPNAENKEMSINRAANAAETMNQVNSGVGRNFADMSGLASIARKGGVGEMAALNLKSLDNATIERIKSDMARIQKLDPRERVGAEKAFADRLTDQYGLGQFVNKQTGGVNMGALNAGIKERGNSIFRSAEFVANIDPNTPGYQQLTDGSLTFEQIKNDPKYAALREKLGESSARKGLSLQEALTRGAAGDVSGGASAAADAVSGKTKISDTAKNADDLATAQFQNMTKEARLAAKELGGVAEALSKISKATEGLAGKLNDGSADEFRGSSAKSAKDFTLGVDKFQDGVKDFGAILSNFARGANIKLPSDSNSQKRGGS